MFNFDFDLDRPQNGVLTAIAILLALILFPLAEAFAEDVPPRIYYTFPSGGYGQYDTVAQACAAYQPGSGRTWTPDPGPPPRCLWAAGGGTQGLQTEYACPTGSSRVGTGANTVCRFPTSCEPPQVRNPTTYVCETPPPSCEDKTGQVVSSGLYLQGNTATTPFPNTACNANCSVKFQGDVPGASQLVGGKTTFYAKGHWEYSGFDCSAGEGGVPGATPVLPPPTCGAGQVMGQINGNTVCINNGNGKVDNPNSPEKTEEKTKTPPVQNPDGSTTETETTTKADGSTTVITTTTNPDGSSTTTTTTTPGAGSSTSSGGGNGSGNGNGNGSEGNEQVDICKTNPNIPACKETDSGDAASTDGLYEVDPERKTFGTILEGFADKVQQLGWYQSVSGFFTVQVPGGSCGGMSGSAGFGGYSFDYDLDPIFCGSAAQTMYSILSIGVQLAATWIAFSIAFL